jgi:hypothetical protein
MERKRERRHLERFEVPGAKVLYKQGKGFHLFERYTGPLPLKDITKNGACIAVDGPVEKGTLLKIEVQLPNQQKFRIKGHVVWTSYPKAPSHAGVQFLPYGQGKKYNSFDSHELLERLTQEYLEAKN